jgi:hypothetical protein
LSAADQTAVDQDRIRPDERDWLFRRRVGGKGVGKRAHSGVKGAACDGERLLRLQDHGEFGKVKTANEDQGAGAELCGVPLGMSERVPDLAQRHKAEARRQRTSFYYLVQRRSGE